MPLRAFKDGDKCSRCKRWLPHGDDNGTTVKKDLYCLNCLPGIRSEAEQHEVEKLARAASRRKVKRGVA